MVTLLALFLLTVPLVCNCNAGVKFDKPDGMFLENVTNYPSDVIHRALIHSLSKSTTHEFRGPSMGSSSGSAMGTESGTGTVKEVLPTTTAVTKVFGRVSVANENWNLESPACETTVREITPRQGLSTDGEYRFIVNDPLYQQKIYTQICKYNNEPCGEIQADLRSGYQTICQQSYTEVQLLTFRNDSGNLHIEVFQLPVSCDCYLQSYLFT